MSVPEYTSVPGQAHIPEFGNSGIPEFGNGRLFRLFSDGGGRLFREWYNVRLFRIGRIGFSGEQEGSGKGPGRVWEGDPSSKNDDPLLGKMIPSHTRGEVLDRGVEVPLALPGLLAWVPVLLVDLRELA
jgi:hypothetical protein